jgi:hypothetical protein
MIPSHHGEKRDGQLFRADPLLNSLACRSLLRVFAHALAPSVRARPRCTAVLVAGVCAPRGDGGGDDRGHAGRRLLRFSVREQKSWIP